MRALVTGGAGFIGSHVVRRLLAEGWEVDAVDDLSTGNLNFLGGINFRPIVASVAGHYDRKLDTRNPELILYIGDFVSQIVICNILNKEYDFIFHLAANPRVEYSVNNPLETTETNFSKTLKLMTHSLGNIKRFIFSSSCAVFGDASNIPTAEKEEVNPNSPYGLQKAMVEQAALLYGKLYEFDSVCLRYFNVYGPCQFGDSPYSTAIASWCDAVKSGKRLRSDGDGTQSRDLIFVEDVAEANYKAAICEKDLYGEIFNIGTGSSISNNRLLDMFQFNFPNIEIQSAPTRVGDVMRTRCDINKAVDVLNFTASKTIHDGLESTFLWWGLKDEE